MKSKFFGNLKLFITCFSLSAILFVQAQNLNNADNERKNPITTAVPFLLIPSDARAASMGFSGVSFSPDAFSIYSNAAKYAFSNYYSIPSKKANDLGSSSSSQETKRETLTQIGVTLSPWIQNENHIINVAVSQRISKKSTLALATRYFKPKETIFTDIQGERIGNYQPLELGLELAFIRKISNNFSFALSAKYIKSDLTKSIDIAGAETQPVKSFSADVSVYHQHRLNWEKIDYAFFTFGLSISNIGSKVSYFKENDKDKASFIPTNLRFGPSLIMDLNAFHRLSFCLDVNKLLAPTQPLYATDEFGNVIHDENGNKIIEDGKDPNVNALKGIVQSWYDAPNGFKEEIHEFYYNFGTEYSYRKAYAIRAGFLWEHETKGNRKILTLGAGVRYAITELNLSYLVPIDSENNPLRKTVHFSLFINIPKGKD